MDEWTRWDFVLANTLQTIEDLTDQNGLAVWVKENPRVDITADAKVDKFERAKGEKQELAGKNTKVKKHGVYYVPNIVVMDGEYPTLSEWYESKREE